MLEDDGFDFIGPVTLELPSKFLIQFQRVPDAQSWYPAIYAFRIGGVVVRIGKTQKKLGKRIAQWNRDVSRALAGDFHLGGTNPWEAFEWRRRLTEQARGEFFAQLGPADNKLLHHRERELINRYDPCLCNDTARARLRPPEARSVRDVAKAKQYWRSLNLGLAAAFPLGATAEVVAGGGEECRVGIEEGG